MCILGRRQECTRTGPLPTHAGRMTKSKIALVTGANRGIGREVARRLAELEMTVLIGARNRDRGEAALAALRTSARDVQLVILDVADEQSVRRAACAVSERFGKLDVLVNNAGICVGPDTPSKQEPEAMRQMFATNVFGPLLVTQALLPLLARSASPRIVNVSSALGSLELVSNADGSIAQLGNLFGYAASKTALNALTLQLAHELRDKRIKVNAACPGHVATDLNRNSGTRSVEQGAEIVVRLATIPDDGPTGGFFNDTGRVPW